MAVGVADERGELLRSREVATPQEPDAELLWETLVSAVRTVADDEPVTAVGVGCGGPMRWPSGDVSPLNIPGWREFPLRSRLEEMWPGVPVVVHNDAIAFALGEFRFGASRGWQNAMGVVVSTGVGGGLILDGEIRPGPTGNAGHIGHIVVEPYGPPCGCGGHGCVEAVARGPAVVAWALEQGWSPSMGRTATARADDAVATAASARDLAASARDGDAVAVAAFARAGQAVGLGIASAAALLDLDGVVVGGGLAGAGELLFGPLRAAMAHYARLGFTRELPVVPSSLGRQAGLIGAAALIAGM